MEIVAPNPAELIDSLRDFGYSLESALADLVDNSLTAKSNEIQIVLEPSDPAPHIAIIDDGIGMSENTLVEAMRMGTVGPQANRSAADLGRFGLGLKTASLSQGQCVTVLTKASTNISVRQWDIDHIRNVGKWQLLSSPTTVAHGYLKRLQHLTSGTVVVIEKLDRVGFATDNGDRSEKLLSDASNTVRRNLAMVFHRFIESGAVLRLGSSRIEAWDPFLTDVSQSLPLETLSLRGIDGQIAVQPYVLPHHSQLEESVHERAAGLSGWHSQQGFYVYRCRRLIVPGSWLNLRMKKEDFCKLARIRVDLPNTMDSLWQLNVMKSHVSAPPQLRDDFRRIAETTRRRAVAVYRVRGERQSSTEQSPEEHFIWRQKRTRAGVRYVIDRKHPAVLPMLSSGQDHDNLLETTLKLIEASIPIASILQQRERSLDGEVAVDELVAIEELSDLFLSLVQFWVRTGKSPEEARLHVLGSEPFVRLQVEVTAEIQRQTGCDNFEESKQ